MSLTSILPQDLHDLIGKYLRSNDCLKALSFFNLNHLDLSNMDLKSVKFINHLNPVYLDLSKCYYLQEDSLAIISRKKSLKYLSVLNCHRLKNFQCLSSLTRLETLNIYNDHKTIDDFYFLSKLNKLKTIFINIDHDKFQEYISILPLSTHRNYYMIDNSRHSQSSIIDLTRLTNLREIELCTAGENEDSLMRSFPKLKSLKLNVRYGLIDLSIFNNLRKLNVTMYSVYIDLVKQIQSMTNLVNLSISILQHIDSIDLTNLTYLKSLRISTNRRMSSIELKLPSELETFIAVHNHVC